MQMEHLSLNPARFTQIIGFRFHDCRHHAVTELAESQASDSTIMAFAGHVSRKMLEHYSHLRQDAKREAVNFLSGRVPQRPETRGYDTIRSCLNRSHPM
jgi:integrase